MQLTLHACTVPGSVAKYGKLRLLKTSSSELLKKVLRQKTGANFLTKSTKKNKNFFLNNFFQTEDQSFEVLLEIFIYILLMLI